MYPEPQNPETDVVTSYLDRETIKTNYNNICNTAE